MKNLCGEMDVEQHSILDATGEVAYSLAKWPVHNHVDALARGIHVTQPI
jgi:hypothetical protein